MSHDIASSPIACLSSFLPRVSETFVYREIRELRRRGRRVRAVSLHPSADATDPALSDVARDVMVVYAGAWMHGMAELLNHPLKSLGTLCRAMGDALFPGERTPIGARMRLPLQALAAIGLARRLRAAGIRHLHCHFAHSPTTVGMYAARQLGIPFSFTGHANDIFQRRALLGLKLRRAKFAACISRWHRELYNESYPAVDQHYPVVRCGVDTSAWTPGAIRETVDRPLQVLTLCRLVEKKGIDTLIRGLHELGSRGRDWRLTVAGDGPERQKLEALAKELGCADRIAWAGAVANERVPELMSAADVFALPCKTDSAGDRDGIPVVLMEAMASGVPVVSGDLPAIRELIEDNVSGFLIDGRDPKALAGRLDALAGDFMLRKRLAEGGRRQVEMEFALAENVSRLEAYFPGAVS